MFRFNWLAHLTFCAAVATLSACGGGGSSSNSSASSTSSSSSSSSSSNSSGSNSSSSSSASYTVSGTVTGLTGTGLVLTLNGANNLTVNANGPYTFATTLANNATYAVSFNALPGTQVCSVAAGSGTISGANVTNANITCATPSVTGTTSGLTGTGLVLQLTNLPTLATTDLPVSSNGTFSFPSNSVVGTVTSPTGVSYALQIKTQPTGQTCTIVNSLGVVNVGAPTSTVAAVACTNNITDPLMGTYQATASNLGSTGRAFITLYADGTYIFAVHEADPTCTANNGDGLEYGVYNWNQTTHAFSFVTVALDTNGDCGIADGASHAAGTLIKNGDGTLSTDFLDTNGSGAHFLATWTPVPSTSGTLIGSWTDDRFKNQGFNAYTSDGKFFQAISTGVWYNNALLATTSPGIEDGCYVIASGTTSAGSFSTDVSSTCAVSGTLVGVDTNGSNFGLSANSGTNPLSFSVSGNTMETWIGTNPHSTATRN